MARDGRCFFHFHNIAANPTPCRFIVTRSNTKKLRDQREGLLTSIRALNTALNVDTNEAVHNVHEIVESNASQLVANTNKLEQLNLKKDYKELNEHATLQVRGCEGRSDTTD